ncbi:Heme response regulator HssR [Caprobacter fermentans]|uniref:Heme response regulator HssR n=1 Tax=Caproicibacter fermentans TaxID=2576756 RepID=A0A6N8HXW7_9FIRM|nr:response regulator transcription factor [Caproicibacter fermentans]MVB10317.1 Heme response regulator HssR [Caproicibacter fermentans]OCN03216.1 DNA-binding response regulator [Clostridium sp. W14A]
MNRILIVDDDEYIRELVSTILKNEGFLSFTAVDGRDALQKMTDVIPELCIIDIMMPKMDGFELCRQLRKYYEDIPILMLTAKDDITQKVKGYELGTDDYLTKPFEPAELIIRVKALLRRYKISSSDSIQINKLTIDRSNHTIYSGNDRVGDIPLKEFELLCKLARSQGKIISRGDLIEEIWGYDFEGNERTLDVHINRLRMKFPPEVYHFKITAIRGIGYRLEVIK